MNRAAGAVGLINHDRPPELERAASVRVANVSRTYARSGEIGLRALENISLAAAPGEFCSIVGPSGCGKSTLLMTVAGLYLPTSGDVFINDVRIGGPYTGIGMVFQRDVLLEWRTVLDNVLLPVEVLRLPKDGFRRKALDLLEMVGLGDCADAYPEELSGGMRQRVSICRALVHSPPLLLMDEPFASVDALTREKLNLDLMRVTREWCTTVLFITHSIEEAVFMSDRVVIMSPRPGRVLKDTVIQLERPRLLETRADPRFHQYVDDIREVFHSMGII